MIEIRTHILAVATLLLASSPLAAPPETPASPATPPAGSPPSPAPAPVTVGPIAGLVAADSKPVHVAGGFRFTEGPAADGQGQLYFVDVPSARILTLASPDLDPAKASSNTVDFLVNNGNCFGLAFDAKGQLFATQGSAKGSGLIAVDREKRTFTALKPTIDIDGTPTPVVKANDLTPDSHGGIYFTDPSLGRTPSPTRGVLYRAADGSARRVNTTIDAPNGVRMSPDGAWLYVLSYGNSGVYRCPVKGPGTIGDAERFGSLLTKDGVTAGGRGDGLAIDMQGNLWCTNPDVSEVQVVSPAGKILGRIAIPEPPSNCAFGGADGKTLYITAVSSVYALRTEVTGYWPARVSSSVSSTTAPSPAGR